MGSPQTNGIGPGFHKMLRDEFQRVTFRSEYFSHLRGCQRSFASHSPRGHLPPFGGKRGMETAVGGAGSPSGVETPAEERMLREDGYRLAPALFDATSARKPGSARRASLTLAAIALLPRSLKWTESL